MILGINGKIGSGKDLCATIIQYWIWKAKVENVLNTSIHYTSLDFINNPSIAEKLSDWKIIKFADKLKDIVCILLGCTRKQLEDREFKEKELGEEWWYTYGMRGIGDKKQHFLVPITEMNETFKNTPSAVIVKLTPRKLLQQIGTDLFRNQLHPNIWVNATMADYIGQHDLGEKIGTPRELPLIYPNWIITDVRFPNEAEAIKERGGINIRIERWVDKIYSSEEALRLWEEGRVIYFIDDNGIEAQCQEVEDFEKYSLFATEKKQDMHISETALDSYSFDYTIENNGTIEELFEKVKEILIKEKLI